LLRDRARHLAPLNDREGEFRKLNSMIGTLLNTHQEKMATPQGRARAAGIPLDTACIERLGTLIAHVIRGP
jgi:hypothetical protein